MLGEGEKFFVELNDPARAVMARDQGARIVDEDLGRHAAERGERAFQASSFLDAD